jgi:hypothetical protein
LPWRRKNFDRNNVGDTAAIRMVTFYKRYVSLTKGRHRLEGELVFDDRQTTGRMLKLQSAARESVAIQRQQLVTHDRYVQKIETKKKSACNRVFESVEALPKACMELNLFCALYPKTAPHGSVAIPYGQRFAAGPGGIGGADFPNARGRQQHMLRRVLQAEHRQLDERKNYS